ncbi:MAG TPA: sulfotransferase [Steroidobacteraceae bacterium]|nr:sulfotransferase [Steroidobacteraceae bacterium]
MARRAAQARNWATVHSCASEILRRNRDDPEGHFLAGLVQRAAQRPLEAANCFARALELDPGRYDAAIELASRYSIADRQAEAFELLERYQAQLGNSPRYLDMAGITYTTLGLHERAWPLHLKACALQPGVPVFEANLAACAVTVGRTEQAIAIYRSLLERSPTHQRHHYELSRLVRARDEVHLAQMQAVLRATNLPPDRNIFLHYAIGKELEDLERWAEAFHHYRLAGDAAAAAAGYDVVADLALIDRIIEVCSRGWLQAGPEPAPGAPARSTPIFIVGLPRSGTTLVERILASHSRIGSIGETQQLESTLRRRSGVAGATGVTPAVIEAASRLDPGSIAESYLQAVAYRLGAKPMFIEKYPENFLYLGFISRSWPQARLVHVRRLPMDACFAMYKQSYFRYAYRLEDLGRYYVAHDRLLRHWHANLGDRLVEVEYEALVADPEAQTRALLARLRVEFEPACLEPDRNPTAVATASSAQVREKIHARSVGRWRYFREQLEPLRRTLEAAGIATA